MIHILALIVLLSESVTNCSDFRNIKSIFGLSPTSEKKQKTNKSQKRKAEKVNNFNSAPL